METIRTFVAILLSAEIRTSLDEARRKFTGIPSGLRWEGTEKLHITLKFLGDVQAEQIPGLQSALTKELLSCTSGTLTLERWGFFPHSREPRYLYTAPGSGNLHSLDGIVAGIERAAKECGFPEEKRPFHPHVTVGRIKTRIDGSLIKMIENTTLQPLNFSFSEIAIMQSRLSSTGSHYTCQFTIPLKSQE